MTGRERMDTANGSTTTAGAARDPAATEGAREPLRVLLIANTLPPDDVSGVGEQVLQLAAGLRGEGCTVEVLGRRARRGGAGPVADGSPRGGPPESRDGAAGPKVLFPLTVVPATWRALRRLRPHVVQVHESDGALAALVVRLARRILRPRPRLLALLQVSYAEERRAVRPLRAPGRPRARGARRRRAPLPARQGAAAGDARPLDRPPRRPRAGPQRRHRERDRARLRRRRGRGAAQRHRRGGGGGGGAGPGGGRRLPLRRPPAHPQGRRGAARGAVRPSTGSGLAGIPPPTAEP